MLRMIYLLMEIYEVFQITHALILIAPDLHLIQNFY